MKWITRKDVKVDRVACPWLIQRFVNPEAEFLFAAKSELIDAAKREQAIPFDAPKLTEINAIYRQRQIHTRERRGKMHPKHTLRRALSVMALGLFVLLNLAQGQTAKPEDPSAAWKPVQDAMGRPGKLQPDGTFKFAMPRKDLKVTVNGTPIKAGLALGSWVSFAGSGDHAMAMGDLVLTESEIGPVMTKLQQEGIEQTAIHNHLLHETPRVLYMHIEGHGDALKMAKAIHDALALSRTPAGESTPPPAGEQKIGIDVSQINTILGRQGKVNGGILQISAPRAEKIMDHGMEIPPSMGTATALNFQPTGNGRAAITGDFVLLANEVNPVLKTLLDNGIQVTALHSHMLNDEPHLFFMHFWANDNAIKLAKGLHAALDHTNSAPAK